MNDHVLRLDRHRDIDKPRSKTEDSVGLLTQDIE